MNEFLLKLLINIVISIIIIRFIYYKSNKNSDYVFTYFIIGLIVFLLCYLLKSIELQLGFALGLFAIFGIIRYRTSAISIKEMTYLFSIIGLSIINSLTEWHYYKELILSNIIVIIFIGVLEKIFMHKKLKTTTITYANTENFNLQNEQELIKSIEKQLNITIQKIDVKKIDYLNNTTDIVIHYSTI
ncbi:MULTISPECIES: DUF4956 domain-containing protein [unclassified Tenacibaculum]|uniref:DUF4956 domain-containing protein n=1 Tax=unclassified Tenacibaculum TaxID=2635139 RepID=UPI001F48B589|nr:MULTISPECIES: DUF4956 domain-containing protein [unclassified Tenacibaculum]MCF2875821.1 DUF4956 domain-containing protein [Tenacibaculum sp. Cn5-1]MCF2935896.1 DUF4956 domain-containing protein [Tenacibaculum sp. Cn5-34]MCG7512457.1 DUF4956 domain-containing protein [Tenacibaculum sp. Cn5-46]